MWPQSGEWVREMGVGGAQGDSDCSGFGVRCGIHLGLCHSQRQDFGLVIAVAEAGTVTIARALSAKASTGKIGIDNQKMETCQFTGRMRAL